MFFIVLWIAFVGQVLSEAPPASPPAPPQNIHVDNWLLTWTPATEDRNVTYTVQYSISNSKNWNNVPSCIRISNNSCHVESIKADSDDACMRLRVRAQRGGLKSIPVEACSRHGDTCTPNIVLTALPGSLTVHLGREHDLSYHYGDLAKHSVYYGKEGEQLTFYKEDVSTVTINGLEEGQRYCTKVQYTVYSELIGPPSCIHCALIPESKKESDQTGIIVAVVIVLALVILMPLIAYIPIFHWKKIKQFLRPQYQIPEDFYPESFPADRSHVYVSTPCEERYDVISFIYRE